MDLEKEIEQIKQRNKKVDWIRNGKQVLLGEFVYVY